MNSAPNRLLRAPWGRRSSAVTFPRAACLATLAVCLLAGTASCAAEETEWLMRLNPTNTWKVTQVQAGLSSTVYVRTTPSATRIPSFTRLAVLRDSRVLGFVRVVGPAPTGFSVGSLGRTLNVSMLRYGDMLSAFMLEVQKRRTWEDLPQADKEETEALIALLGDDSYAQRETATASLKRRGREILSKLRKLAEHNDPEVRTRAREVGTAIACRECVVPQKLAHTLQRRSGRLKPLAQQGFLGVSIANVQHGKLPGALITQVLRDSPAERSGIRLQDVILAIDGQVLDDSTDVLEIVSAKDPRTVVRLKIQRGGGILAINATLASRPIPMPL